MLAGVDVFAWRSSIPSLPLLAIFLSFFGQEMERERKGWTVGKTVPFPSLSYPFLAVPWPRKGKTRKGKGTKTRPCHPFSLPFLPWRFLWPPRDRKGRERRRLVGRWTGRFLVFVVVSWPPSRLPLLPFTGRPAEEKRREEPACREGRDQPGEQSFLSISTASNPFLAVLLAKERKD